MKNAKSQCMRWRPRFILSVKFCSLMVSGSVFGISNTAVTPPITALRGSGFQIFLVGLARLAEMHLGVDHAGQDVQALAVDHLGRWGRAERTDLGDSPIGDADVADALAVLIDDRCRILESCQMCLSSFP